MGCPRRCSRQEDRHVLERQGPQSARHSRLRQPLCRCLCRGELRLEHHSFSPPRYQYDSRIWIGVHFGSRGLGHNIATGFLKLGSGLAWDQKAAKGESYDKEEPTLLDVNSDLGIAYLDLMGLAGDYAYAGRDDVVDTVRQILGAAEVSSVHNHHNFAWLEEHDNELLWVVRKGATPLWPGQESFIGGSMCDVSVIARGTFMSSQQAPDSLHSTVHGAGRKMGRAQPVHRIAY